MQFALKNILDTMISFQVIRVIEVGSCTCEFIFAWGIRFGFVDEFDSSEQICHGYESSNLYECWMLNRKRHSKENFEVFRSNFMVSNNFSS